MKSERRCEVRVWDSREAKRNGMAPVVAKGTPLQVIKKLLDLFVLAGEDIDNDFDMLAKKLGGP